MAFESLTERLQNVFKNLRKKGKISESDVQEATKEIRLALLEADVALPVVKDFIKKVRERAVGHEVIDTLNPAQQIIKIVDEELTAVLGSDTAEIIKSPKIPTIIMMVGLQGAGKTTFAGKLANKLKKEENARPLMIAADIYRPAAIDQLKTLGQQIDVPVFALGTEVPAVEIVRQGLEQAQTNHNDYVLIDTAGRLHVDTEMMDEIKQVHVALNPIETLFTVDAMTGQDAANTAKAFNEALPLTGVILTKVDGDARGGAALSIRQITGKPIKFLGVGEKTEALEPFHPDRVASRILGMGDVLSLIEDLERSVDREKAEKMAQKFKKGDDFTLDDFREQLIEMKKMGGMMSMLEKLPGAKNLPDHVKNQVDDKMFVKMEAIINSMTLKERANPDIIKGSRRRRIALGSGTQVQDVNKLLKQFDEMQRMMKKMRKGGMAKMMRGMQGLMGGGLGSLGGLGGMFKR